MPWNRPPFRILAAMALAATSVTVVGAQTLPVGGVSRAIGLGNSQAPESKTTPLAGEPKSAEAVAPSEKPAEAVAQKRAENAELLRVAEQRLETSDSAGSTAAQEVALYKTVNAVLAQQEAVERQIEELQSRKGELEKQLRAAQVGGVDQNASVSIVEFDRLKDALAIAKGRADAAANRLATTKAFLERAQKSLSAAEAKQRQAQEAYEAGKEGSTAAQLSAALEQAKQSAALSAVTVTLRRKEVLRGELSSEVEKLAIKLAEEKVIRARPRVVFAESDLQDQITQIKKQEESANESLLAAQANWQKAEAEVRIVQGKLDEATEGRDVITEQVAAAKRRRERWSEEIDLWTSQLQRLAQLRIAWNHRYAVATAQPDKQDSPSSLELKEWQKQTQAELDVLEFETSTRIGRMSELRSSLTSVTEQAEAAADGAQTLALALGRQRTQLEAMLRRQQASLMVIESSRGVHRRLLEEIGQGVAVLSPVQIAADFWQQVQAAWNYNLFTVGEGDQTRYITVKKVVKGLLLLFMGWFVSRLMSRLFANRFLRRFRLSQDATAAIRTIVFYTLLVVVALVALRTVDVPLTAFTILGGALAIGIGFGSQALINNFIGGLIMLAERPVRLGELIQFGELKGTVEEVGFRCTKLRTLNDHLVTIPNSTLVNDSIENITRRRTIRRLMNVTITYDTPREKVAAAVQAIRDILEEKDIREPIHPIVGFEELLPRVYFNDYNSESLNILVLYWYSPPVWWDYHEHCQRVNLRIMEEFAKLGVEFAFPTRTLYLAGDSRRELAVRVQSNGGGARSKDPYAWATGLQLPRDPDASYSPDAASGNILSAGNSGT